jgi:hypothetical protein
MSGACLTLLPENVGQRSHLLREVFNGLRHIVTTGAAWRRMPNDLPRGRLFQQAQRLSRKSATRATEGLTEVSQVVGARLRKFASRLFSGCFHEPFSGDESRKIKSPENIMFSGD